MARILVLIALGVVIWLLVRGFLRRQAVAQHDVAPARSSAGEDMVRCARCGVNLPRSETRMDGSRIVCRDNPRCIEAR
jgi:uncharacterized protein